jgi:hypothetical protein
MSLQIGNSRFTATRFRKPQAWSRTCDASRPTAGFNPTQVTQYHLGRKLFFLTYFSLEGILIRISWDREGDYGNNSDI